MFDLVIIILFFGAFVVGKKGIKYILGLMIVVFALHSIFR